MAKQTRYTPIENSFFKANRRRLADLLPADSMAVLNSNDLMPTNSDGLHKFVQQSDLYYLSGIDQEETVLLLRVNARRELIAQLFVRETSPLIAIWEGEKLAKDAAREISGVDEVFWLRELPHMLKRAMLENRRVYLNDNEHARAANMVTTRDGRFREQCQKDFPLQRYRRLAPLMHGLRVIKQPQEIEMMSAAVKAGAAAFRRVLQITGPGLYEFELEAEMTCALLRQRSRRHAFPPIIAAGASACILHYEDNNRRCKDGDLVLLDYGAEYGNYNCDISRTIPVNGRFSPRQREVYDAVKSIHDFAVPLLRAGVDFNAYNLAVRDFAAAKIVELKLAGKTELADQESRRLLAQRYMPHGVSHFLGLDVHDVGSMTGEIKAGMVLTCEPGLYLAAEGLGIRLESDILVTADVPVNLTAEIPMEADAIEAIMARPKPLA